MLAIELVGLVLGVVCAIYFCHVAGAERQSPLGMLRLAGFVPMLIADTAAVMLSVRFGVWETWFAGVHLMTLLIFGIIAAIPFWSYKAGLNARKREIKQRQDVQ